MKSKTEQTTAAWRGYGDETAIGKWIRDNPQLPSRSQENAFTVNNTDLTVHAYMQAIDGMGTRQVQSIIRVEFKSHGKQPDAWQLDTLFKEHAGINRSGRGYRAKNATIINHGIYLCVVSGRTPADSETISWGRFTVSGDVDWITVTKSQLDQILRFDVHPKTLRRQWLRRHHKTVETTVVEKSALGFEVERQRICRT